MYNASLFIPCTTTEKADGPNTAYDVSKFEDTVYYETIDSINVMEPSLTSKKYNYTCMHSQYVQQVN